jgi:hypothetical protein
VILYVWELKTNPIDSSMYYDKIAIIDRAVSVIWIHRARASGYFEIMMPATAKNVELFRKHELLVTRSGHLDTMIPERVEVETTETNGDTLLVSGRSAESILGRRIVPRQWIFPKNGMSADAGNAENCVRYLVYDNMINTGSAARNIALVSLGAYHGDDWSAPMKKQVTGKNLLDVIPEICTAYNLCFRMDFENGGFKFRLYKGTNRSYNQSENPRVVFSPDLENIGDTTYTRDMSGYCNAAYIAGEGEGTDRRIAYVSGYNPESGAPTIHLGLLLRETWVDARNVSSNGETISDAEYTAQLMQQGRERLSELLPKNEFSGELMNTNGFVFGRDYDLGDTVSVVNRYGIRGNAAVLGIAEVEDATGYRIYPELSEWIIE